MFRVQRLNCTFAPRWCWLILLCFSSLVSSRAVGMADPGRINDSPVCSNRGDASMVPAAEEDQLSLAVLRIHVEGSTWRLSRIQGAAHVGGEHYRLQVVTILPWNLDDGFTIIQLNLLGIAIRVTSNTRPDEAMSELDADEWKRKRQISCNRSCWNLFQKRWFCIEIYSVMKTVSMNRIE